MEDDMDKITSHLTDRSGASLSSRGATNETSSDCPDLEKINQSPGIRHVVENMSEEQWKVVHKALREPTATPELGHLCSNIVTAVTQTTWQHLLPALSKMLGVPVKSLIQSGMAKPRKPSHWSQVSQYQTALCELFGITEDSVCNNLRQCRQQCERDVVGLVLLHVNSVIDLALKQHILKGGRRDKFSITESTLQATKDLVCAVSTQANVVSAVRASPVTQVSTLETASAVTNSDLVSVTRAVINAITDHMSSSLDGDELEQVGGIITAVAERVKMLASQNATLESPLCNTHPSLTQDQLDAFQNGPQNRSLRKLSTDKFHAKATKAVSEVLMRNFADVSVQGSHRVPTPKHLSASHCSVDQASSAVLEAFIQELKSLAQYAHCLADDNLLVSESKPPQTYNSDTASFSSDRSKAVAAAHMMFHRVRMKLMEIYSQPSVKESSVLPTETEDISVLDQVYQLQIDSATREVVNEIVNTLNDEELGNESSSSFGYSSSQLSMAAREFVCGIISQLQNYGTTPEESTSSPPSSELDFSGSSLQLSKVSSKCSEICASNLQALNCDKFYMEASRAVSDTLLKSVGSQSSTSFSSQTLKSDTSGLPEESMPIPPQNMDLVAFNIIQSFVSEIKLCAASIEALTSELQMDADLLESGSLSPDAANQSFQKTIMTSVKGIYNSMHDKVQQFFTQNESDQNETVGSSVQQDCPFEQGVCAEGFTSPERVENSTLEVIRQLSSLVKTALTSEGYSANSTEKVSEKSSCVSLKSSTFVDDVICELKDVSASVDDTFQDELTANLHDSISLIDKLSNGEFQAKVSHQVSEVLFKSAINHSDQLHGKATGDSEFIDVNSFIPSVIQSQAVAYDLVGEVMEEMVESLISSGLYSLSRSTASDIVETVTGAMKDLLEVRLSCKALQLTDGDSARVPHAISARLIVDRICLTAQTIFVRIKTRASDFLQKHQQLIQRNKREASAKKAISQVLASIQDKLPDTEGAENSEQIQLIHDLLSTMMEEVQSVERDSTAELGACVPPDGVFKQKISPGMTYTLVNMDVSSSNKVVTTETENPLSRCRGRFRGFLSETNMREYSHNLSHQICQILTQSYDPLALFMSARKSVSDSFLSVVPYRNEANHETPFDLIYSCVEESVKRLILSFFFPLTSRENQERILQRAFASMSSNRLCDTPPPQETQHTMESSISSRKVFRGTMNVLTQVLAKEVMERLSFDVGLSETSPPEENANTFSQLAAGERQQPPKLDQMETTPSISESSSKTSLSVANMAIVETVYAIEEASLGCSRAAPCLSTRAPESYNGEAPIKLEDEPVAVTSVGPTFSQASSEESPETEEASNRDFACLISLLVIRLLSKTISSRSGANISQQESHHDEVLDMSRELMDKILPELFLASGITRCQSYPEDMNILRIYPNTYQNLVQEYGSSSRLRWAAGSRGSSFETSLIKLLASEINTAPTTGNVPEVKSEAGNKTRRFQHSSRFQTPLKLPKISMEKLRTLQLPSIKKKQHRKMAAIYPNSASARGRWAPAFTTKLQGLGNSLKPLRSCPVRIPKLPKLRPTVKIPKKYSEFAPCLNLDTYEDVTAADENTGSDGVMNDAVGELADPTI